ncbi:hypothetical protein FRX31_031024 [Thalictrum thalictroides]|uniref:Uncharacterized protein n=1 Tax=Thalictrum thalictroides TaxID=46969 RepID=A0A7J6V576_THATH|nr:hypothetical protein FRX31_031024 [Thalictrum thalictroides]
MQKLKSPLIKTTQIRKLSSVLEGKRAGPQRRGNPRRKDEWRVVIGKKNVAIREGGNFETAEIINAGPSSVRNSQGVEITSNDSAVSECRVVERISPTVSPKATFGVTNSNADKTVLQNRFNALQTDDEEPNDNQIVDSVVDPDLENDGVLSNDTQNVVQHVEEEISPNLATAVEKPMVDEKNQQAEEIVPMIAVLGGNTKSHSIEDDTIHFQLSEVDDILVTNVFGVKFGRRSSNFFRDSLPKVDWGGKFLDDPIWGTMIQIQGDLRKEAAAVFYQTGIASIEHIKIYRPKKSLKKKFNLAHWGATNVEG